MFVHTRRSASYRSSIYHQENEFKSLNIKGNIKVALNCLDMKPIDWYCCSKWILFILFILESSVITDEKIFYHVFASSILILIKDAGIYTSYNNMWNQFCLNLLAISMHEVYKATTLGFDDKWCINSEYNYSNL